MHLKMKKLLDSIIISMAAADGISANDLKNNILSLRSKVEYSGVGWDD
jgi:hypothetical protein